MKRIPLKQLLRMACALAIGYMTPTSYGGTVILAAFVLFVLCELLPAQP